MEADVGSQSFGAKKQHSPEDDFNDDSYLRHLMVTDIRCYPFFTGLGSRSFVTVEFFQQNGTALSVPTNRGTNTSFSFALEGLGEVSIRTLGTSNPVRVGWAKVTGNQPVGATEVFQLVSSTGQLINQAAVLPTEASGAVTLLVAADRNGRNTGIALANLSLSVNPLTFTLYDQSGNSIRTSTTTLSPQNQLAKFIDELPGFQSIPLPFEGSMVITGLARFSVVTLLLDNLQLHFTGAPRSGSG